ncbi:MAG TPA: DUF1587 domain-containing protein, partial [Pirellulales bacterium]|nr:DUF1587 domain-containing protein [Pirellulales bacterium]
MIHRCRRIPALCCLTLAAAAFASRAGAAESPSDAAFRERVKPFLAKYCIDCHSGAEPESKLALDRFADAAAVSAQREVWTKLRKYLQGRIMPPKDAAQPTDLERRKVIDWIDTHFSGVDCSLKRDPGRVTLRRLNRTEYDNTVRDLVGIDFQAAEDFPADDVGYGFDNIGDVLSMPPILLEKYLAAADQIVDKAIYVHTPDKTPKQTFTASEVQHKGGNLHGTGWYLASSGEVFTEVSFPSNGEYMLRGRAFATQAGDELAKMAFRLDDKQVYVADVAAQAGAAEVYETKVRFGPGKHRFALAFINDFYDPDNPDSKRRDRNLAIEWLEVQGPLDAPPPENPRLSALLARR